MFILIVSTTLVKICLPLTLVASSFYFFCLLSHQGNVPTKNNSNNKALGRWVSTQRANYKKLMGSESLTKKISRMDYKEMNRRISRLNAINFSWSLLSSNTQSKDVLDNDSEK